MKDDIEQLDQEIQQKYQEMRAHDFLYAKAQGEIDSYLRGEGVYHKQQLSGFCTPSEPTDTSMVLDEVIEDEKRVPGTLRLFFSSLDELLEGSAADAYLVFTYLVSTNFKNTSGEYHTGEAPTLRVDYAQEIAQLEKDLLAMLRRCRGELEGTVAFANGWKEENPWSKILSRSEGFCSAAFYEGVKAIA